MEHPFCETITFSELSRKEVVNSVDGACLGHVCDLEFNLSTGCLLALIVPQPAPFFCFGKREEVRIPMERVEKIGEDVILVCVLPCPKKCVK